MAFASSKVVETRVGDAVGVGGSAVGLATLAALLGFAALYFVEGFAALFAAWQVAEYSHGPIIPLLSALLFLRCLKQEPLRLEAPTDRWPGLAMLAAALAMGLLGKLARIDEIVAYALILFAGAVVLIGMGWRRGRTHWAAVLHLVFMLPLPGLLYWKISTTLQFISSELGVWFIQLAGVPVFLDGNIIDLGTYKLHVAEACSGLRYLFPVMSFSYVFATLYRGPVWHKALLLLAAAPLTVFMNSVRIGIVGVAVDQFGIGHVTGIQHFLEGWVIFISCIVMLFGMVKVLLMLQREKMSLSESLDLDFEGLGAQVARLRGVRPSAALICAVGMTASAAAAWQLAPPLAQVEIDRRPLALFSPVLGDWRHVSTQRLEPQIEQALGADDYYSARYAAADHAAPVDVFVAWYRDQTRGGIHSPEVCLPGGGWEMAEIERIDVAEPLASQTPFPVNRAVIQKGEARLLVYYWFEQYGGRTAWDYAAKAQLLRDAVLYGRTDGALGRVITAIRPGERIAEAEARILDLMPHLAQELPRFVPKL